MTNVGPSLAHFQRRVASMNIYVGNLSLDTTEEELRREFISFGEVISVVIMSDKYIGSGQTSGYAFVEMASKSEGEAAITSLKGKRLRKRMIDIVEALPLSDNGSKGSYSDKRGHRFSRRARQRED